MSGSTTSSGTPISALPLASSVAQTDTVLGIVGGGTTSGGDAQQVSVAVLGGAISSAAGIPDAVSSATQAAMQADAAAKKSYAASTQAVEDQAGVAGGVAQLDNQAQLYLQGKSVLAVTPATSATSGAAATPAMLSPLLPVHPDAIVGGQATPLGAAVKMAAGSVQSSGGDASDTVVKAEGALVARSASARAADAPRLQDYGTDGTAAGDAAAFVAADAALAGSDFGAVMPVAHGAVVLGDNSDALAAANKTVAIGKAEFKNFRRKQSNVDYLPSPIMFAPTVRPEHLTRSAAASITGTIRVAVMGDSIWSVGDNLISTADYPIWELINEIKLQNPGVDVEFANFAIGGTTWSDMNSDTYVAPGYLDNPNNLIWKARVAAYNPDMLILHSAGNDGYGINAVAMQNLVTYLQTAANFTSGNIPDLIFGVTYQPSLGSSVNDYIDTNTQNGIDFAATYVRNYARANNYGYLDFGRWHAMCRDGIDPCELVMERVIPAAGTTLPAFNQPIDTTNTGNAFTFPAALTGSGVSATSCTSGMVCYQIDRNMGSLQFALSSATENSNTPLKNMLYVTNDGGYIKCAYTDGVATAKSITSTVAWPTSASSWTIMLKDSRLTVQIQKSLGTGWNVGDPNSNVLGMGYETIFDEDVARFGAPFTPVLQFGNNVTLTIYNLCVADATTIQSCGHRGSQQRYRPIVSDYELYVANADEYGGSGAFHMNAYGWRIIFAPVIRSQMWGSFRFTNAVVNNLLPYNNGGITVQGALEIANWLRADNWVQGKKSITMWGAGALASQPVLTLTNPTANETALANLLVAYGLASFDTTTSGTTSTSSSGTTSSSSTVTSGGTVTSSTTNG